MEYLSIHRGLGRQMLYEVLYNGEGAQGERFIMNLMEPKTLQKDEYEEECTGSKTLSTSHVRPINAPNTGHVRAPKSIASLLKQADNNDSKAKKAQKGKCGAIKIEDVVNE